MGQSKHTHCIIGGLGLWYWTDIHACVLVGQSVRQPSQQRSNIMTSDDTSAASAAVAAESPIPLGSEAEVTAAFEDAAAVELSANAPDGVHASGMAAASMGPCSGALEGRCCCSCCCHCLGSSGVQGDWERLQPLQE